MDHCISFVFRGQEYTAKAHLSLQADGCYIFTFLQDSELIAEFGSDIVFETDCEVVLPGQVSNDKLLSLKTAILEAVKALPSFKEQRFRRLHL